MKTKEQQIQFHYVTGTFHFTERTALKRFIMEQLKKEGKAVEAINYIFCDDAYLLNINKQYLNHDTLTDIITFELSAKDDPLIADIYISVERVRDNAVVFKTSFSNELRRVIFHGALHLAGYKDKSKKDEVAMRKKEEEYLTAFHVSRSTVSR